MMYSFNSAIRMIYVFNFLKIRQTDRITKCWDSLYLTIILILSGRNIWVKPRYIILTYKPYATTLVLVEFSIMTDIGLDIDTCTCVCVCYLYWYKLRKDLFDFSNARNSLSSDRQWRPRLTSYDPKIIFNTSDWRTPILCVKFFLKIFRTEL